MIQTPIVFFGPYSGSLPDTFPLTVASMRANQDCCTFIALHSGDEFPRSEAQKLVASTPPSNFHWVHLSGSELEQLYVDSVGVKVQSRHVIHQVKQMHHKWNDWRVFAPRLLKDRLAPSVEFWGYLEHDQVYGKVVQFLSQIRQYDLFTAADAGSDRVSAPFVLHRLGATTDFFVQRWLDEGCLVDPMWLWCDEAVVTDCMQHPADSAAPCAAPDLRSNIPVQERQLCTLDESGTTASWTSKGETFCEGQSVLGLHFHARRSEAATAFKGLGRRGAAELIQRGWVFTAGLTKDPECDADLCPSSPTTFRAGTTSSSARSARLGWKLAADGSVTPAVLLG